MFLLRMPDCRPLPLESEAGEQGTALSHGRENCVGRSALGIRSGRSWLLLDPGKVIGNFLRS